MSPNTTTSESELPSVDGAKEEAASEQQATFGSLARRIRGRTTDLLAIAIILTGGLVVGSQVSRLFDDSPAEKLDGGRHAAVRPFDPNQPVELDFGNSPWSLRRSNFTGTREAAGKELLAICLIAAKTAATPTHPPGEGERKLLAKLAASKPVAETAGRKLYRVHGPIIMASATAPVKGKHNAGRAAADRRVICWGLAFPAGNERWVTYLFTPKSKAAEGRAGGIDIPLPASAKPVLTIRGSNSLTCTFRTAASVAQTTEYFDTWLTKHGWTRIIESQGNGTAVYQRENNNSRIRVELRLSQTTTGETSGLIIATRIASRR